MCCRRMRRGNCCLTISVPLERHESVPTDEAQDRVTFEAITSPESLPAFRRSTMDGYAVRAADTFGAGESLPAFLRVVGEVPMGKPAAVILGTGEAALVHTGGMLPDTADAVVQVEHTQLIGRTTEGHFPVEIEVLKAVADGQNVLQVGEDVAPTAPILKAGHRLRPQDLGGLLAVGLTAVTVRARPRVAILATGDEVIPPSSQAGPGQIRDINSYTIAGQVRRGGGEPVVLGIVGDDYEALRVAAASALASSDMLVMTAGSSVSVRDVTVEVIDSLGQPGVLLHGVATRPGKPTIVGVVEGKPVLGLPGNPVSAMIQFDMFGVPALERLLGVENPRATATSLGTAEPEYCQRKRPRRLCAGPTPGRRRIMDRCAGLWQEQSHLYACERRWADQSAAEQEWSGGGRTRRCRAILVGY